MRHQWFILGSLERDIRVSYNEDIYTYIYLTNDLHIRREQIRQISKSIYSIYFIYHGFEYFFHWIQLRQSLNDWWVNRNSIWEENQFVGHSKDSRDSNYVGKFNLYVVHLMKNLFALDNFQFGQKLKHLDGKYLSYHDICWQYDNHELDVI